MPDIRYTINAKQLHIFMQNYLVKLSITFEMDFS